MRKAKREKFLEFVGNRHEVRRILVVRNGLIGDTLFVTPVLERLHGTFPQAELDMATSDKSVSILKNHSSLNAVFAIPAKYSIARHARFFLSLRKFHYDIVVIQESNSHYVLMAKLTGGRFLVGFENKLDSFLDFSVGWEKGAHAVRAELETVRSWTNDNLPVAMKLDVTEEEKNGSAYILRTCGVRDFNRIVCIHPGVSVTRSQREWVPEYYSRLADMLIENSGVEIVIDGVEQDGPLVESIIAGMKNRPVSILGKTGIRQFMGVLKLCKVLIGPDTGTSHLATAVGTPVVMLFGRSDPADSGPFDPTGRSRLLHAYMPCIGCIKMDPPPQQWNICKDIYPVVCMGKLTPETVYNSVVEVLNLKGRSN